MSDGFCYVGIAPCGCMRAATVDDPDRKKDVARDVRDFIKGGCHIERVLGEVPRVRLCFAQHDPDCPHPNKCPEAKKKIPRKESK